MSLRWPRSPSAQPFATPRAAPALASAQQTNSGGKYTAVRISSRKSRDTSVLQYQAAGVCEQQQERQQQQSWQHDMILTAMLLWQGALCLTARSPATICGR